MLKCVPRLILWNPNGVKVTQSNALDTTLSNKSENAKKIAGNVSYSWTILRYIFIKSDDLGARPQTMIL